MDNNNDKKGKEIREWIKSFAVAIIIAIFIKTFIFNSTYVLGNSMYPTLHERDRLFAFKFPLYFSGPDRGDIVVLEAPDNEDKDYIKRVIGIGGDLVQIIDGQVYLNGQLLEEDYIEEGSYTEIYSEDTWLVPEGEVFLLGDNRREGASKDSRYFGCVPLESIKGITGFRYFPLDKRFGKI
ncbi:MAG: signal peptidase I [Tissierellaceae bacterium]|nr:signal peptidase I [Tissierellia bacterium]